MLMEKIINVGLIGFGIGGQLFHAPIITSVNGLKLVKLRATKEEQITIASTLYPDAEVVNNAEDIFNDVNIELVVISSPNTTHHALAKKALLAGKHVVLDKPFAINTAEADELMTIAKEQNKMLTVYHNRRFDSDFLTIKKLLQTELLGELVEFESHFDRFHNAVKKDVWREEELPGSGILYDLGSHLIDQAVVLFGVPEAITADLRIQRSDANVIDNFELVLHYKQLKVTLKAGMLVRAELPRFILCGTNGSFIKYGMDVQEDALKAGQKPANNNKWGEESPVNWGKINTEHNGIHLVGTIESEVGNYVAFYQNIYDVIKGNDELCVTPEDARATIRIIELAMQSNAEKRTVAYSNK